MHSQSPEINAIKRKNSYLNNLVNNKELISIKAKEKSSSKRNKIISFRK